MSADIKEEHKIANLQYNQFAGSALSWRVLPADFYSSKWLKIDLSKHNRELDKLPLQNSMHPLGAYIEDKLLLNRATVAYGGWQEERTLYQASAHFDKQQESRSIHLGVDLWFKAGIEIICPFPARVHSFQDNNNFLDYGPTIILEHQISDNFRFFSLYGHLSRNSLSDKKTGQIIEQGQSFAKLGSPPENGDWPAHLHFQIILDLVGRSGDYPGVSTRADAEFYKYICPNPALLLEAVS